MEQWPGRDEGMRMIRFVAPLLLAVAAGVVALARYSSSPAPALTLFQQGALIPLLRGEEALKIGQGDQALTAFSVVALRARRASAGSLLERVDTRLASGGYTLWMRERRQGWTLLSRLVMWSGDFGRTASAVESKLLGQVPVQTAFRYELLDGSGQKSVWGRTPVRLTLRFPIAVPERLLQAREPWTYNFAQCPPPAKVQRLVIFKLDDRTVTGGEGWRLEFAVAPHSSSPWYASVNNLVLWGKPLLEPGFNDATLSLAKPGFFAVDRLLSEGASEGHLVKATLVHEYRPLGGDRP
jgi:hypothetical protein